MEKEAKKHLATFYRDVTAHPFDHVEDAQCSITHALDQYPGVVTCYIGCGCDASGHSAYPYKTGYLYHGETTGSTEYDCSGTTGYKLNKRINQTLAPENHQVYDTCWDFEAKDKEIINRIWKEMVMEAIENMTWFDSRDELIRTLSASRDGVDGMEDFIAML